MSQKAWEIERHIRLNALPLDRRVHPSRWSEQVSSISKNLEPYTRYWKNQVPGSGAPDSLYVGMVQSMANKGYEVSEAEALLPLGLELAEKNDLDSLRPLTALLMEKTFHAPKNFDSPYWRYQHPLKWEDIVAEMSPDIESGRSTQPMIQLSEKIYYGWVGQLAGGSFGTALEGYSGEQLSKVYGRIDEYITIPETTNDDVVYELVLLDVFAKKGRLLTSRDLALEWVQQIPYGYSAEWVALQNIKQGIFPPDSGSFRNAYSDWIGAQMRGMVCGMLAPGWPLEAARLAAFDAVISHSANGIYGEIFAAVLTSLSFIQPDIHQLIDEAAKYLPQRSEYSAILSEALTILKNHNDPQTSWKILDERFKEYNWIHAYPNLAADLLALWYGAGDMSSSFSLLAMAGLDVDCNGGLVGNILGIIQPVPEQWSAPLGDLLETYLPGKETLSIQSLAERTAVLAMSSI